MDIFVVLWEILCRLGTFFANRFRPCLVLDTRLFDPSIFTKARLPEMNHVMIDWDKFGGLFTQIWLKVTNPPYRPPNSIVDAALYWEKPVRASVTGVWTAIDWPGVLFQSPVMDFPIYLRPGETRQGWVVFHIGLPFRLAKPGTDFDNVVRLLVKDAHGHSHSRKLHLRFTRPEKSRGVEENLL